jgi:DNA-binding Xre family transcriptional regulator
VVLVKFNIDALLHQRGLTRKDLAQWCQRSESWISKIFRNPVKQLPAQYWDRIADCFGLATYQLLQPGISKMTERRNPRQRRSGRDRRISHASRVDQDKR